MCCNSIEEFFELCGALKGTKIHMQITPLKMSIWQCLEPPTSYFNILKTKIHLNGYHLNGKSRLLGDIQLSLPQSLKFSYRKITVLGVSPGSRKNHGSSVPVAAHCSVQSRGAWPARDNTDTPQSDQGTVLSRDAIG